ncbi:hypothetical protein LWI28_002477 [Acer negundo]|uniref:Uncharacterized protein n=1 Tax=Acer negundo TaxID=4023 RepID=A0AAD5NR86_ACENE|nr:hypothetical protein LWI28_002477 [Acer negundo]
MEGGNHALGWCDMEAEMLNYEGDSEKDDKDDENDEANGVDEGDNRQYNDVPLDSYRPSWSLTTNPDSTLISSNAATLRLMEEDNIKLELVLFWSL